MSAEADVREASESFYAALNRMVSGDAAPLTDIWAHGPDVTAMHPIGGRQVGWDQVRATWEQVATLASSGSVRLDDQQLQVGSDMACETGIERGRLTLAGQNATIEHRVTNVYRRGPDGWKIVHHHTDISQKMLDILSTLQG
jgi:ketosteroid isomerase-like protein